MLNFLQLNLFLPGCTVWDVLFMAPLFLTKVQKGRVTERRQQWLDREISTASKSSQSLDLVQPSGWKVEAWRLTHLGSLDFVMASCSNPEVPTAWSFIKSRQNNGLLLCHRYMPRTVLRLCGSTMRDSGAGLSEHSIADSYHEEYHCKWE